MTVNMKPTTDGASADFRRVQWGARRAWAVRRSHLRNTHSVVVTTDPAKHSIAGTVDGVPYWRRMPSIADPC